MRVELLHIDGCPGAEALVPRLRRLLDEEGIEAALEMREIEDGGQAERERFLGSPTVRIDCEDVDPGAAGREDFGFKCRLYRDRGRTSNSPPEAWIRSALRSPRPGSSGSGAGAASW